MKKHVFPFQFMLSMTSKDVGNNNINNNDNNYNNENVFAF